MSDQEQRLIAENGRLRSSLAQAGVDAARKSLDHDAQSMVLGELHHRVKNMLAMVQAIATQTLASATSLKDARRSLEARLVALGQVHDLLLRSNWSQADLKAILQTAVSPFGADRFVIDCPSVEVAAGAALPLGMVLNELCTNAVKHGALSTPGGMVNIVVAVEDDGETLNINWKETGGPAVTPPLRRSFGTRLIEKSLNGSLKGHAALEFSPDGVACTFRLSLQALRPPVISLPA